MNRVARAFSRIFLLAVIGVVGVVLWERFVPAPAPPTLAPIEGQIDRIVIEKSARRMTAFQDGVPVRSYPIALGFAPEGNKTQEGDGRTPEGIFKIDRRNAQSAFHLSLGLDYPHPEHVARARAAGVSPGGNIFIHGQPNGLGQLATIRRDWTAGCIAVSDAEIEELWSIAPIGTVVEIRP